MRKLAKYLFAIVLCFFCFTAFIACGELEIDSYSIKEGTMDLTLEQGDSLDTSSAKLVIKYKNGETKEVPNSELEFDKSGVNTNEVGEHTLKVKYDGKEYNITVTVTQKVVVTGIVNKNNTVLVTRGDDIDTANISLRVNFNNGTYQDISNTLVTFDMTSVNTNNLGLQNLKLIYQGVEYQIPVLVLEDDSIQGVDFKAGTIDLAIFKGETLVTTNAVLIVSYKNGTSREIQASELTFNTANLNNQVAGSYQITVTYEGVPYSFTVVVSDVQIVDAHIKPGTMKIELNQGESLDLTGAVLVLEYNDGSEVEIPANQLEFDASQINTLAAGTQTLVVTYNGEDYEISITINPIKVTAFASDVKINHAQNTAEKPVEDKQIEFVDRDNAYLVGDDNAMDWQIRAAGITEDAQILENLEQVETRVIIKRVVGGSQEDELLDANGIANSIDYVDSIDRFNAKVDFSENAVGETFLVRVELVHYESSMFNAQNPPYFEHTIKVVDGYNVYDAYGLSLFDNANSAPASDLLGTQKWSDLKAIWEEEGLVEEGFSQLNPKSLIIHKDIVIKDEHIPNKNFYYETDGNSARFAELQAWTNLDLEGTMYDTATHDQGPYVRLVEDEDSFAVHGNYFKIDASGLTRSVITEHDNIGITDTADNKNEQYITTHTALFRVHGAEYNSQSGWSLGDYAKENFQGSMLIEDLTLLGNAPRGADALYSGGIILLKATSVNLTAQNTIHKDFFIGYFPEYGRNFTMIDIPADTVLTQEHINKIASAMGRAMIDLEVGDTLTADHLNTINTEIAQNGNAGLNNSYRFINNKAYNDYNTFMYVWGAPNVYVEGGEMISCGGPAIIADHVSGGYTEWNQNASLTNMGAGGNPSYIDVVNCKIESKVFGTEPWFNAYDAVETITQIKTTDAIFNAIPGAPRTFLTNGTESNINGFINMVFLYKFGAKSLPSSGAIIRGYFRQFETIEDYTAYYTTGKLADGSNYYGYESTGDVSIASKMAAMQGSGEQGRFESQSNGSAVAMVQEPSYTANPKTLTPSPTATQQEIQSGLAFNYGAGKYTNAYLCNGFGAVFQLFDYTPSN